MRPVRGLGDAGAAAAPPIAPREPAVGAGGAPTVLAVWRLRRVLAGLGLHPAVHATAGRVLDAIEDALGAPDGDPTGAADNVRKLVHLLVVSGAAGRGGGKLATHLDALTDCVSLGGAPSGTASAG